MRLRLTPEERRRRIVDAAVPLFARKGFSGTTTKEIAEAACVSEGLVFKYFASKNALYAAILDHCQTANPEFERLAKLPPSTAALVEVVSYLTGYFAGLKNQPEADLGRHLLFMRSLLEDGEFAVAGMQVFEDIVKPVLAPCIAAARESGDLTGEMSA
ncbi:MAG: TetR/AcrR family transcriptional regulator, partial [Rhodobacteraceae bacterium]|nr:TetR/AcrR family transcriptional regulator [Paracoccaceae bacterium]